MTIAAGIINAAQVAQRKWGIPAAISLAQYGLESGWGAHMPPGSNNPFGIKARAGQPSVTVPTHEFVGGRYVTVDAVFAAYPSVTDAFDAHAQLLGTSGYYADARSKLPDVDAFADALTGVYATDPQYGAKLITLMKADNLYQYDVLPVASSTTSVSTSLAPAQPPVVINPPQPAPSVIPIAGGAPAGQPVTNYPQVPVDQPITLPNQVVAQIAQLGTHAGAYLAGILFTAGLITPGDEVKIAGIGGSVAVLLISVGANALAQYLRHKQAVVAVAAAKAS